MNFIDKIIPDKFKKHIPNTITVGRVLLAFGFISAFLSGNMPVAISLFAGASISDAVDGYLARRWKVQSKFGKNLDPFADKLLVGSAILLYGSQNPIMYAALLGELSIAIVNIISIVKNKKVEVSKIGKMKTILLMTTVSLSLLSTLINSSVFDKIISLLVMLNIPFQGATLTGYIEKLLETNQKKYEECDKNQNNDIKDDNELTKNKEIEISKGLDRNDKIERLKEEKENLIGKDNPQLNKQKTMKNKNL